MIARPNASRAAGNADGKGTNYLTRGRRLPAAEFAGEKCTFPSFRNTDGLHEFWKLGLELLGLLQPGEMATVFENEKL